MDSKQLKKNNKKPTIYVIIIAILVLLDVIVLVFSYGKRPNKTEVETSVSTEENVVTIAMKSNGIVNNEQNIAVGDKSNRIMYDDFNKSVGDNQINNEITNENTSSYIEKENKNLEWNLILVNAENKLPDDYDMELENIDKYRKFDSRAINYLKNMLNAMKSDGIKNCWIQSSYRNIEHQTQLYENKTNEYMRMGYSKEEAQKLTEKTINKPGHSEHNLGLAVDFNYVNNDFENTESYKWLKENAKKYGFVLRYPKDKEQITKVKYEPWHWRYVGEEHATKMDELNMCLEEYVEYLRMLI